MIISILKEKIKGFAEYLAKPGIIQDEPLLFYETQFNFQKNWDISNPDLLNTYKNSLHNSQSRRFWQREKFNPKEAMQVFIEFDQEFVRLMFKDLFNESKDVAGRIDRFIFYCDELLSRIKSNTEININNHNHDIPFIYFYLAIRYPQEYAVYDINNFKNTLNILKAANIPEVADPQRYYKTSLILNRFIKEETALNKLIKKHLNNPSYFTPDSLIPVSYFCYYCSNIDK